MPIVALVTCISFFALLCILHFKRDNAFKRGFTEGLNFWEDVKENTPDSCATVFVCTIKSNTYWKHDLAYYNPVEKTWHSVRRTKGFQIYPTHWKPCTNPNKQTI